MKALQLMRSVPRWAWWGVLRHQLRRRFPPPLRPTPPAPADFTPTGFDTPLPTDWQLPHTGTPLPDWHTDSLTGYRWQLQNFQLVGAFPNADVRLAWEHSRFHPAVRWAVAFRQTGDTRYALEFVRQVRDWWQANPFPHGIHYCNPMELAIRSANWIVAWEWLYPALPADFHPQFWHSLHQHAQHIWAHLETAWPRTNHLLADLCGLMWLGKVLMRPQWVTRASRLLRQELRHQLLPDGASYEGSTAYHWLNTEMLYWTVQYLGWQDVADWSALVEKMLAVCGGLQVGQGFPRFGDDDSGHWLPLPLPVPKQPHSWASEVAGWYVLRDGADWLAVTLGKTGTAGWGGHNHNDALSFEVGQGATRWLCDPASYLYGGSREQRNLFRSTAMHNTVRVNRAEQNPLLAELFHLPAASRVQVLAWEPANGRWVGQWQGAWSHTRTIRRVEGGWQVVDDVLAPPNGWVEWFFHFDVLPVRVHGLQVETVSPHAPNLSIAPISGASGLQVELQEGWLSPQFGQRVGAPLARFWRVGGGQVVWELKVK
jgi:hypothetical protein